MTGAVSVCSRCFERGLLLRAGIDFPVMFLRNRLCDVTEVQLKRHTDSETVGKVLHSDEQGELHHHHMFKHVHLSARLKLPDERFQSL